MGRRDYPTTASPQLLSPLHIQFQAFQFPWARMNQIQAEEINSSPRELTFRSALHT